VLIWPSGTKVFVCTRPTDMRCGFDSLAEQVRRFLGEDPLGGHLFVFQNRRRDRLKVPLVQEVGGGHLPPARRAGRLRQPVPR